MVNAKTKRGSSTKMAVYCDHLKPKFLQIQVCLELVSTLQDSKTLNTKISENSNNTNKISTPIKCK